jgi:hypothetical protein
MNGGNPALTGWMDFELILGWLGWIHKIGWMNCAAIVNSRHSLNLIKICGLTDFSGKNSDMTI